MNFNPISKLANPLKLTNPVKLAHLAACAIATLALVLTGCSPQDSTGKSTNAGGSDTPAGKPAQPYEAAASQGKGFTVGAMMSTNTVYVMFDPQCPHCGHLWEASVPLHKKVKFVWMPVAFINAKSGPQGAALLTAADPAALMAEHETSILAGGGGISAIAGAPIEIERAIKKNTQLFNSMGVESVPFVLAKNLQTGQVVTHTGALTTAALTEFLGIN
jgi:thiol:disulfide interchange protein DsbG